MTGSEKTDHLLLFSHIEILIPSWSAPSLHVVTSGTVRLATIHTVPKLRTSWRQLLRNEFSRNNLFPCKGDFRNVFRILCPSSVLILKVWASITCSINVSAHYFCEWVEISFVGLAGVLLRLRKASQRGETCVRAR